MKKTLATIIILIIIAAIWPASLFAQNVYLVNQEDNNAEDSAIEKDSAAAQDNAVKEIQVIAPEINIYPQTYIAGEQTLYLEGTAPPDSELTIYLKKNEEIVKRWLTNSNEEGKWTFSTEELIRSGNYYLQVRAEKNEVMSALSSRYDMRVSLSGIAIGSSILISSKKFAMFMLIVLFLLFCYALYFVLRAKVLKQKLRKEAWEAREMLDCAFDNLNRDIQKKIEMFDTQPGFSETEKRLYEDLHGSVLTAKLSIENEIKDVEKMVAPKSLFSLLKPAKQQ